MKNAQPTSRDKGIKEGRLDFTTPPLKISLTHTQNHSTSIHAHSLKTHNLARTHTHTQRQQKNSNMDSLLNTCFHKVTEPAN